MKKTMIIPLLILASICVFLVSCSGLSATKDETLIVGTNAEYPPYTFIDKGEIVGFDIDIAKEVCKRLGKTIKIRDVPFDGLLSELLLKRVDFIAAGMTKTDERAKKVAFTQPYYSDDLLVIVSRQDNPVKSIQEFSGKKIVVNEGYTADLFASGLKDIEILRLPAPADALMAINSKRADAFITARSTAVDFTKDGNAMHYVIAPIEHVSDGVSLVVSKDNPALLNELNSALNEMKTDGTIEQLKSKWGLE